MSHKVDRLERKKLFNTPLLINSATFESVTDYLEHRPDGLMSDSEMAIARDLRAQDKKMNLGEGKTALISVEGALTYEETMFGALCGMSSYQGIIGKMEQAISEGFKTVVLDVNSGGGEAYGVFETAKTLKKLAEDNDIRLIAYVDGMSASAAYGLTVAAGEVIVNPMAEVGSIGVLTRLVNDTDKQKMDGLSTTYIFAGDSKIPFDAEGEWREDFLTDLQTRVDSLYDGFVSHVASMRNISEEVVRGTQAKVFSATEALSLGLIDATMERMEFAEYLADIEEEKQQMPLSNLFTKEKEDKEMTKEVVIEESTVEVKQEASQVASADTAMLEEMKEQLATLMAQNETLKMEAKAKEDAVLLSSIEGLSFIEDTTAMAGVLGALDKAGQEMVVGAFAKADTIVTEAIAKPMSIEGEVILKADGAVEDAKAVLDAQIAKKYKLGA